jgi:hypothetical protein
MNKTFARALGIGRLSVVRLKIVAVNPKRQQAPQLGIRPSGGS